MKGTKFAAIVVLSALVASAGSPARAQWGHGGLPGPPVGPHGGGGSNGAQIAGEILGIIGGAMGSGNGGGSGQSSGGFQQNSFGNDWLIQTPKYRWKEIPQYETRRVYVESGNEDELGHYENRRVQTGTQRVRVQDGYNVTPNIGNIITDFGKLPRNVDPPSRYYPNDRYYDNRNYGYSRGNTVTKSTVPKNTVPPNNPVKPAKQVATKPNLVPKRPVQPLKNAPPFNVLQLTSHVISAEVGTLQVENEDYADTLKNPVKEQALKDADALVGYDQATKDEIKRRIENEQPIDDLLTGLDPVTEAKLKEDADLIKQINELTKNANDGKVDIDKLADLAPKVIPFVAGNAQQEKDAAAAILGLAINSQSIASLQDADLNSGVIPWGDADVILVGGLAEGQIASLGNGTMLVGTGNPNGGSSFGTGNVAQLAGYTAGIGDPVPDSDAQPVTDGVVLMNAGETAVNYTVNGHQFTIEPGYRQTLPAGKTWTVTFDRGGSFGTAKYGLSEGTYEFTAPEDKGWELFKRSFKATIGNDNPFTFHYVVNNQQQSLAADQKQEHTGDFPLVILFDDGRGNEQRKRLTSGVYRVAVSPEGAIDLYEEDDVAPPVKIADVIPADPTPKEFFEDPKKVTERLFTSRFTPEPDGDKPGVSRPDGFHLLGFAPALAGFFFWPTAGEDSNHSAASRTATQK